jgi:hypothetical protein
MKEHCATAGMCAFMHVEAFAIEKYHGLVRGLHHPDASLV